MRFVKILSQFKSPKKKGKLTQITQKKFANFTAQKSNLLDIQNQENPLKNIYRENFKYLRRKSEGEIITSIQIKATNLPTSIKNHLPKQIENQSILQQLQKEQIQASQIYKNERRKAYFNKSQKKIKLNNIQLYGEFKKTHRKCITSNPQITQTLFSTTVNKTVSNYVENFYRKITPSLNDKKIKLPKLLDKNKRNNFVKSSIFKF